MTRLNILLFLGLIVISIAVVASQHESRKLHTEHEVLKVEAKKNKTEYEVLQLEQSAYAMHSKVEDFATKELNMEVPDQKQIRGINLNEINR